MTVEAALDRFHRYVEAMSGSGDGRGRWQQARELVEDLRAMGDVGAQALLQVRVAGNDTDERRAAARRLGQLQVPQALGACASCRRRSPSRCWSSRSAIRARIAWCG